MSETQRPTARSARWPPSRMFRACSRVTVDGVASGPPHMAQQPPMVE